ncbi:MAG: hypothetical protein K2M91_05990 [Lachnospiraceae bacterium]|nr:hypothetical protein [Lachnospiraceae bacterium]
MKKSIDIQVSPFRIAVNVNPSKIKEILKGYSEYEAVTNSNYIEIFGNENYDENLSASDEDAFLYYESNIDIYPKDDALTLEKQIQWAKGMVKIFAGEGILAEIIAEFEHLL